MRTVIGALLVTRARHPHRRTHPGPGQDRRAPRDGPVRDILRAGRPAPVRSRGGAAALVLTWTPRWAPSPRWRRRPRLRHGPLGRGHGVAGQPAGRPPERARSEGGLGGGGEGQGGGRQDPARARLHRRDRDLLQGRATRWTTGRGPLAYEKRDGAALRRAIPTTARRRSSTRSRSTSRCDPERQDLRQPAQGGRRSSRRSSPSSPTIPAWPTT